jgi:hypothetical protein
MDQVWLALPTRIIGQLPFFTTITSVFLGILYGCYGCQKCGAWAVSGIKCDYYNHYNLVDVVFLRFIMTTITTLRKQLYVGVSWIDPYELGWFCKAILN